MSARRNTTSPPLHRFRHPGPDPEEERRQFKTAADLAGHKVGVGLGTNYEQWLKDNVPKAIIKTYDDDPTKYQDLRVGRIDAILVDRLAAFELIKKTNDTLAVSGEPFSARKPAWPCAKASPNCWPR